MQWYFALTEDSTAFRQYAEMIMVAVHTAQQHTTLQPHCIYDGGDNDFTAWLTKRGVRIIQHRSFVRDALEELGRRKGNPHLAAALSGAFSRVELPEIVTSGRILYTDCDVFFLGDVVPATTGIKLETVLGRERAGEDHSFSRTETVPA